MPQRQNPLAALNAIHGRLASAIVGGSTDELCHVRFRLAEEGCQFTHAEPAGGNLVGGGLRGEGRAPAGEIRVGRHILC